MDQSNPSLPFRPHTLTTIDEKTRKRSWNDANEHTSEDNDVRIGAAKRVRDHDNLEEVNSPPAIKSLDHEEQPAVYNKKDSKYAEHEYLLAIQEWATKRTTQVDLELVKRVYSKAMHELESSVCRDGLEQNKDSSKITKLIDELKNPASVECLKDTIQVQHDHEERNGNSSKGAVGDQAEFTQRMLPTVLEQGELSMTVSVLKHVIKRAFATFPEPRITSSAPRGLRVWPMILLLVSRTGLKASKKDAELSDLALRAARPTMLAAVRCLETCVQPLLTDGKLLEATTYHLHGMSASAHCKHRFSMPVRYQDAPSGQEISNYVMFGHQPIKEGIMPSLADILEDRDETPPNRTGSMGGLREAILEAVHREE